MTFLVDTSVWSLALRRDSPPDSPHAAVLRSTLQAGGAIATTGIILQELLQGVLPERARTQVVERFESIGMIRPSRADHVAAAALYTACRTRGIQLGTVDALIAQLCITYGLTLLTTDRDFEHASRVVDLRLWRPS